MDGVNLKGLQPDVFKTSDFASLRDRNSEAVKGRVGGGVREHEVRSAPVRVM